MLQATLISAAAPKTLRTRPVFVQGIMQDSLLELTGPLDVTVNGVVLRLPVGCVISLTGGRGQDGCQACTLMSDLVFVSPEGGQYRTDGRMQGFAHVA